MIRVPFQDLKRQYESIRPAVDQAMRDVIESCEFIGGKAKTDFERDFAQLCGVEHCIGVGNGTDAIYLALKALGVEPGDEILVPAMTFIATSEAANVVGARAVFVDVDPKSYLINLDHVENLLKTRAKSRGGKISAVIPVHLYGRMVDMPRLMKVADTYGVKILEDSAQAHLAEIDGKKTGAYGHAATFSFYPGKNLGAYGDAGAVTTNDAQVAQLVRKYANHGRVQKYDHEIEGFNSRLDGLQAAVLNVKMQHLAKWTKRRQELAVRYDELLAGLNGTGENQIVLPDPGVRGSHVYHLYVVRTSKREELQKKLTDRGVQTLVHYPIALPNLKAYAGHAHKPEDFPVSSRHQNECLSLPFFPEMTEEEQDYVATQLKEALTK